MSKITQANKKAKAEGKLKGKPAKTAASRKNKKEALQEEPKETKPSIPNYGKCCTCRSYCRFPDGCGHMCRKSGKPTPRKASCPSGYSCKY